jgi:hypothetical protein
MRHLDKATLVHEEASRQCMVVLTFAHILAGVLLSTALLALLTPAVRARSGGRRRRRRRADEGARWVFGVGAGSNPYAQALWVWVLVSLAWGAAALFESWGRRL